MQGDLFEYTHGLCAFESGDQASHNCLVLLGGLGDGFMTIPYTEALSDRCLAESISFIQVLMKSSYSAFGYSSLKEDAECITKLIRHLKEVRGKQRVVLLGHSTGCQDIMWLDANWDEHFKDFQGVVVGGILQAPVSDREYAESSMRSSTAKLLQWAESVDYHTIHPTEFSPITSYRVKALFKRGGDDDFFSTDLSLEERRAKLFTSHIPLMVVFSENDEYFPNKERTDQYLAGLKEAWPQIVETKIILGADHGVRNPIAQQDFFDSMLAFIHSNKHFI